MYKTFIAGAVAVLAALPLTPATAGAGTRIGVGVGIGEPWPVPRYEPAPAYDPGYDDDDYEDDAGYISCREGRRILRDYGFWEVRPVRCGDEVYRYRAIKRDRLWSVRVSARSGRIISARVIGDDY